MSKIKLVLTYDYELPLGGCRSYQKGLFEPTNRVISLANELNVSIVLFADVCSAQKFKSWDPENYYYPFKNQLQKALKFGHDVQLHIHPHWLTSEYKNGIYKPSDNAILSHFKNEPYPNNIEGIISNSIKWLTKICSEENKEYKCIAYRGGGFNLQPDSDIILRSLYENGIRIDSSMVKKYYFKSDIKLEDYRRLPKAANWFLSFDGDFEKEAKEGILEVPVTTMPPFIRYRINRMQKKILNKKKYQKMAYDHTGSGFIGKTASFKDKFMRGLYAPFFLSFDYLITDSSILDAILKYNLKKYKNEEDVILCAISHPKGFGDYQLSLMKDFVLNVKKNYSEIIEFCTFQEISQKMYKS